MAVAFPMPLLAPVIMKARPAMDTSRSFSTNLLEADRKAFLRDTDIYCITFMSACQSFNESTVSLCLRVSWHWDQTLNELDWTQSQSEIKAGLREVSDVQVIEGQCSRSACLLYSSSQLYSTDTMKTRVCLASSLMRRGSGWAYRRWQQDWCVCVCVCVCVWHQGLQLPPLSWMPLLRAAEGGDKGDREGGTTEAKCPLCSMVSCREPLVSGQSGLPGSSLAVKITQNKGEKGNNHKSTSSDNSAGCILMRKELREIRSGLITHLEPHWTTDLWSYVTPAESP